MTDYKIGQEVTVRDDLIEGVKYGDDEVVEEMLKFCGQKVHISDVKRFLIGDHVYVLYYIEEDEEGWNWTKEMFKR